MKKSLLSLAVIAASFAGVAHAEKTILSGSLKYTNTIDFSGDNATINNGVSGSFKIHGDRDLTDGLQATYSMEFNVNPGKSTDVMAYQSKNDTIIEQELLEGKLKDPEAKKKVELTNEEKAELRKLQKKLDDNYKLEGYDLKRYKLLVVKKDWNLTLPENKKATVDQSVSVSSFVLGLKGENFGELKIGTGVYGATAAYGTQKVDVTKDKKDIYASLSGVTGSYGDLALTYTSPALSEGFTVGAAMSLNTDKLKFDNYVDHFKVFANYKNAEGFSFDTAFMLRNVYTKDRDAVTASYLGTLTAGVNYAQGEGAGAFSIKGNFGVDVILPKGAGDNVARKWNVGVSGTYNVTAEAKLSAGVDATFNAANLEDLNAYKVNLGYDHDLGDGHSLSAGYTANFGNGGENLKNVKYVANSVSLGYTKDFGGSTKFSTSYAYGSFKLNKDGAQEVENKLTTTLSTGF